LLSGDAPSGGEGVSEGVCLSVQTYCVLIRELQSLLLHRRVLLIDS